MSEITVRELAEEIGQPEERVTRCVLANAMTHRLGGEGGLVLDTATADRVRSIFEHAVPAAPIRPTPEHLREDFDTDERTPSWGDRDI